MVYTPLLYNFVVTWKGNCVSSKLHVSSWTYVYIYDSRYDPTVKPMPKSLHAMQIGHTDINLTCVFYEGFLHFIKSNFQPIYLHAFVACVFIILIEL